MLANFINIGGGDIADFSLSNKTVRNAGTITVREEAQRIKEDFKKVVENLGGKESIIIYFDGKALPQFHNRIKSIKKGYLLWLHLVSFPMNRSLGSPSPQSNSGKD